MINRIPVTDINPSVFFGGAFVPVKAIAGEEIEVSATIFREGHDALGADVLLFDHNGVELSRTRMREHSHGSDRFSTWIRIPARGDFTYLIESFDDPFATWLHDCEIKIPADIDAELCCAIGLEIFEAKLGEDSSAKKLLAPAIKALGDKKLAPANRFSQSSTAEIKEYFATNPLRRLQSRSHAIPVRADRDKLSSALGMSSSHAAKAQQQMHKVKSPPEPLRLPRFEFQQLLRWALMFSICHLSIPSEKLSAKERTTA